MPTYCNERIVLCFHDAARVRVCVADAVVADSAQPIRLVERDYPERYYLPRAAVRAGSLVASTKRTHCPYKGDADYFHVLIAGERLEDAAWRYLQPLPEMTAIADHIAFDHARLAIMIDTR